MDFIFATNNKHKLEEIQAMLGDKVNVRGLEEAGVFEDIPENQKTLEGNSLEKARYIYKKLDKNCFADDTGLEIDALNGEPGVFSARYSDLDKFDAENPDRTDANLKKVLQKLEGEKNRKARFRTVITLIIDEETYQFQGIVEGQILESRQGGAGFGYDPIFVPDGYKESFAEMPLTEKNKISHRGRAVEKLVEFLQEYFQ